MRTISDKELIHERLGDKFQDALSNYDTYRRVETLIDEFLGAERLAERKALDVGCGLGHFSRRMVELGANVVACDIGPELLQRTADFAGCETRVADALELTNTFAPESFDVVVSSECIEHTPDPTRAVHAMVEVLKPGGIIALSTPNKVWYPVVYAATRLGLRPFDGLENFSTWSGLHTTLHSANVRIVEERGLHLFPFQLGCHSVSRLIDRHLQSLRGAMINICILGIKEP